MSSNVLNIKLENVEDTELKNKIEAEKAVQNVPSYIEKKEKEITTTNNGEKNFYRPKKSLEVTKIKDLLYEVDNINIEDEIFIDDSDSYEISDDELDEIAQEIGMEKQSRLNPVSEDDSSKSKTKSRKRTREPVEEPRDKGQTSLFNF